MKPLTVENLTNCDYPLIAVFDENHLVVVILKDVEHNCFSMINCDCSTSATDLVNLYKIRPGIPLFITNAALISKSAQETDRGNLLKRKYLIHWVENENLSENDDEYEFIESNIKSDILSLTFDELDKFIRSKNKKEIRIDYLGDCDTVRPVDIHKTTDQNRNDSGVKIVGDYEF
jgi:hypothetical protein